MVYYPKFASGSSIYISGSGLILTSAGTGPLDSLSSAVPFMACSVARQLYGGYSGPLFRVQRSSDSTQVDIAASAGVCDTASLLSFCGSSTGNVVKIYDQTGNGNDLPTSGTGPQICTGGTLTNTIGGKPSVYGGGNYMASGALATAYPSSTATICAIVVAHDHGNSNGNNRIFGLRHNGAGNDYTDSDGSILFYIPSNGTIESFSASNTYGSKSYTSNQGFVAATRFDGTNATFYLDRSAASPVSRTTNFATSLQATFLNQPGGGQPWNGSASEIIVFSSISTTDLTAIETAMSTFFGTP